MKELEDREVYFKSDLGALVRVRVITDDVEDANLLCVANPRLGVIGQVNRYIFLAYRDDTGFFLKD